MTISCQARETSETVVDELGTAAFKVEKHSPHISRGIDVWFVMEITGLE